MTDPPITFGAELRRRRIAAGLSLTDLANRLHYSKGHLSKIETGRSVPGDDVARRVDALFAADGALCALARAAQSSRAGRRRPGREPDRDWLDDLESGAFPAGTPVAGATADAIADDLRFRLSPAARTEFAVPVFTALFEKSRELGQSTSPAVVLPIVVAQLRALRAVAGDLTPGPRTELALLAARAAEFAGWMAQEGGDDRAASAWTSRAVAIATEAGDRRLATYALVRRALVTLYRRDAMSTVQLATQAQRDPAAPPRILALAAQREAQGHALAGDADGCRRALDRARRLHAAAAGAPADGPVIGTSHLPDPVAVVAGWCRYDLGRPAEAAEILDREVPRIRGEALRSWVRFGTRLALAHAAAGHVDLACRCTRQLLVPAMTVDSETVTTDLRLLAATLRRWHRRPAVRELEPMITEALHRGAW